MQLLVLSGPIAVGKTTIASELVAAGFRRVGTASYLQEEAKRRSLEINRHTLQQVGDDLDIETDFQWVFSSVVKPAMCEAPGLKQWLLDAARKQGQLEHLRSAHRGTLVHAHLMASEDLLRDRYETRRHVGSDYSSDVSYEEAIRHPNEVASRALQDVADLIVDVADRSAKDVAIQVLSYCKEARRM